MLRYTFVSNRINLNLERRIYICTLFVLEKNIICHVSNERNENIRHRGILKEKSNKNFPFAISLLKYDSNCSKLDQKCISQCCFVGKLFVFHETNYIILGSCDVIFVQCISVQINIFLYSDTLYRKYIFLYSVSIQFFFHG